MFMFNGHHVPVTTTPTCVELTDDTDRFDVDSVFTMVIWEDGEVRTKDCDSAAAVRDSLAWLEGDENRCRVLLIVEGEYLAATGERTTWSRR